MPCNIYFSNEKYDVSDKSCNVFSCDSFRLLKYLVVPELYAKMLKKNGKNLALHVTLSSRNKDFYSKF